MDHAHENPEELKEKFWKKLSASPFVMLELDDDRDSPTPMTAQLDEDAHHAIWFFTGRNKGFARMGPATANFSSKGHDLFARFDGTLVEETSRERLDKHWSQMIEAWFPGGKDDPNLLMLRMDLGNAKIWDSDLGLIGTAKMFLGLDTRKEAQGHVTETAL
ncbi:MAG: pyridoxamine 5'-phosphate oxidase family protein [Novosphingobium sp.]